MLDLENTSEKVDSHYQVVRKTEISQSDVAKARRSTRERKETYVVLNDELNQKMRNAARSGDFNQFKSVAAKAKKLDELGSQIDIEEREFEDVISNAPVKRQGRVPIKVKSEIHNLYHAGVSNQMQLADEYDISQATVNKIVNDDPLKYRRST